MEIEMEMGLFALWCGDWWAAFFLVFLEIVYSMCICMIGS